MSQMRTMISHDFGHGRFNFRAAGIALRAGRVLVHRAVRDDFWALPGGRVEIGEDAAVALAREVQEELGVSGIVGPMRFVMENFFADRGVLFHEIGFYFALTLPEAFPFAEDGAICHRCVDGQTELEFKWVLAEAGALVALDFQPADLRERLAGTEVGLCHIVRDEVTG